MRRPCRNRLPRQAVSATLLVVAPLRRQTHQPAQQGTPPPSTPTTASAFCISRLPRIVGNFSRTTRCKKERAVAREPLSVRVFSKAHSDEPVVRTPEGGRFFVALFTMSNAETKQMKMKRITENNLRALYAEIRTTGSKAISWHEQENNYHEKIRSVARDVASNGPTAADNLISEMILGIAPVPGTVGRAWNAFPVKTRGNASRYRPYVVPLLRLVDGGDSLSFEVFEKFRAAMSNLSVPPSLSNRVASLFFPTQLVNTVADESIDAIYRILLESNQLIEIVSHSSSEKWFKENEAITSRFHELFPNTDDAWRSCLSWRIHELLDNQP